MYTSPGKWEKVGNDGENDRARPHGHVPVMLSEVMSWLREGPGETYLDCTVGYGGHAAKLLEEGGPATVVVGIDQDPNAIAASKARLAEYGQRARLFKGHFMDLKRFLSGAGVPRVDGVLFDLGVSSPQFDEPERGFSFRADGPLDMRMDQSSGRTAAELVNGLPESDLADLIYQYGEERFSRRIARAIVKAREDRPVRSTRELATIIESAVPGAYRRGRIHCATRTFQALRIAVNAELDALEAALRDAVDVLSPGGRICVISFHSLEDRIVKRTFRGLSQGLDAGLRLLTKKPQVPTDEECRANPRARSAKLRVGERLSKEAA